MLAIGVIAGGGADGVDPLGDQRILEPVAAGAGAQRAVDVGVVLVQAAAVMGAQTT